MNENRVIDYLDHIRQAAHDACSFLDGMTKAEFLADKRSQQAVIMSLIIIGEAVTKVMDRDPAFAARHAQIPWRNRITHGYFDINLDVVWETVQQALPELLPHLAAAREDAEGVG
jgi:uncharacterized protein with HEPN domain